MSRTTTSALEALPKEVLIEITRHAAQQASEHELHATDGHYRPREFDRILFGVNHTTRTWIQNSMENDFAFIEVYYHGCPVHQSQRQVVHNVQTMFQYARNDHLLALRRRGQVQLSTLRIDIRCPLACPNAPGPQQLLVFTEATLFANMLICNLLQFLLPNDSRLELDLTSSSRYTTDILHNTLACMCRYIRDTTVTRAVGLAADRAQTLTNILGVQLDGVTTGDLARLYKGHIRDVQTLLSAGAPVNVLVPVAFWFHIAFEDVMTQVDEPDRDDTGAHDLWCYLIDLDDNNTDIVLRGIANHLLMWPANYSHFFTSSGLTTIPVVDRLSGMAHSLQSAEGELVLLQAAVGRPNARLTAADLKERYKIEELHKTFALLSLGVARLMALPVVEVPNWSQHFVNVLVTRPANFDELLRNAYASIIHVNRLVLNSFYHWSGTRYYPDQFSDLTEAEAGIYYATRMWQQHIALLFHAIRRAGSPDAQVRQRGLEILRAPLLFEAALWRPIQNLAPGELDRVENHFITPDRFPALVRNDFDEALHSVMTEYTMPFYSDPETLEAVHREMEEADLL